MSSSRANAQNDNTVKKNANTKKIFKLFIALLHFEIDGLYLRQL